MALPPRPISTTSQVSGAISVRNQLLEKIRADSSLPTLGVAISKVVEITSSGEDSISDLAHFILSDVALSQKILRLSNTIAYRTTGSISVTTISRAIFLLGFDTIKTAALATLLVDGFNDKRQAHIVRQELVQALCASVAARELAHKASHQNSEEAAVAALFKNIGRVLIASFDHHLHEKIQAEIAANEGMTNSVCIQLMGCTYEQFGELVLQDWHIPETIVHALHALPPGEVRKTNQRSEWLRQVASFSEALAGNLVSNDTTQTLSVTQRCEPLLKRFGSALEIDAAQLEAILKRVEDETRQLAISLEVNLAPITAIPTTSAMKDSAFCNEFMLPAFDTQSQAQVQRHKSGKPFNARDLLLAGVQDATQMLASNQLKLNDLILLILETLYSALGFRFACVCLRDLKSSKYLARIAVGERYLERQKGFNFAIQGETSVFQLALTNNVDLMIADSLSPKIQPLLPAWHKSILHDTRSFIILPLVIDQKPLGLFYADRVFIAEEGVSPDEAALIKTLKGQLLNAMIKR